MGAPKGESTSNLEISRSYLRAIERGETGEGRRLVPARTTAAVSGAAAGLHLLDAGAAGGGHEGRDESKLRGEANNGKSLH